MRKYFSLFVIAGLLLVGVVAFFLHSQNELNKKEIARDLAATKQKFGESLRPLLNSGDPAAYVRDVNDLLKRYKGEIDALGKRNKDLADLDAKKKEWAESDEKKPPSPEQKKLRDEYFDLVKSTYERLTSGAYVPELTGFQNGARVDFLQLHRVTTADGTEMLRADFIAWGFPHEVNWGDIHMVGWVTKPPEKGKPAKKPTAEMTDGREIKYKFDASSARPIISVDTPDHWIAAFPPGATLGYYYLQLLPRDTERLDLTFSYQFTTESGRIVPLELDFKQMPPRDPWLLAPGAKFQATERESSDNERAGRAEDDPAGDAKAPKKKR